MSGYGVSGCVDMSGCVHVSGFVDVSGSGVSGSDVSASGVSVSVSNSEPGSDASGMGVGVDVSYVGDDDMRDGDVLGMGSSSVSGVEEDPLSSSMNSEDATVSDSLASTRQVLSAVSEFLTLHPMASKNSKKGKKQPGGARVLTSEQSLAFLVEKERKKREEEEAKEQRKREREGKKIQREAEKRKDGRKGEEKD